MSKSYRAISEYYDFEIERLAWLKEDVPFFLRQLPNNRRLDILELAAGTGRAVIPLAQAGHRVIGVDYDPNMLAIARHKRDAVGLSDRDLKLIRADVRKLQLNQKFDWIAIFFNTFLSFVTLKEQDQVLQVVRRHLKARTGRFWLDIFQPNLAMLAQEESKGVDASIFYVPSLDRTVQMNVDVRRDPARQVQHVTFNYAWFDSHGRQKRSKREFDLTFIFPRELQILLERNGLIVEKIFGDHRGSPLDADSSRIIARCRLA